MGTHRFIAHVEAKTTGNSAFYAPCPLTRNLLVSDTGGEFGTQMSGQHPGSETMHLVVRISSGQ